MTIVIRLLSVFEMKRCSSVVLQNYFSIIIICVWIPCRLSLREVQSLHSQVYSKGYAKQAFSRCMVGDLTKYDNIERQLYLPVAHITL